MSDDSLMHYGIKGQRWGVRTGGRDGVGPGAPSGGGSSTKAKSKSAGAPPVARKPPAPKASKPAASPSRGFRTIDGKRAAPVKAAPTSKVGQAKAKAQSHLPEKHESKLTPEQRAHRKKMIIGGVAVAGILTVAVAGTAAYKGAPIAKYHGKNMALGGKRDVERLLAQPKIANLRLQGGRKINKAKLNVLFKQAELAERGAKSPLGVLAKRESDQIKRNPFIAKQGIRQDLNSLRRDTEQMRAMNEAEKYVENIVKRRAGVKLPSSDPKRFAKEAQSLTRGNEARKAARAAAVTGKAEREAAALRRANDTMRRKRILAAPGQGIGGPLNRLPTPSSKPGRRAPIKLDAGLTPFDKQRNKELAKSARKTSKRAARSVPRAFR